MGRIHELTSWYNKDLDNTFPPWLTPGNNLLGEIFFRTNKSCLSGDDVEVIERVASFITKQLVRGRLFKVELVGHCDSRGSIMHNEWLSSDRVSAVARRLRSLVPHVPNVEFVETWAKGEFGSSDSRNQIDMAEERCVRVWWRTPAFYYLSPITKVRFEGHAGPKATETRPSVFQKYRRDPYLAMKLKQEEHMLYVTPPGGRGSRPGQPNFFPIFRRWQ